MDERDLSMWTVRQLDAEIRCRLESMTPTAVRDYWIGRLRERAVLLQAGRVVRVRQEVPNKGLRVVPDRKRPFWWYRVVLSSNNASIVGDYPFSGEAQAARARLLQRADWKTPRDEWGPEHLDAIADEQRRLIELAGALVRPEVPDSL